ncbi:MAG: LysR family transcriptional regulator [Aestuariivirga sp.]
MHNSRLMRGLHYFDAIARHRSVKGAAEELGVSQSAVSHQMRELTEALGEQLIARAGRGIELTATGQKLAEKLGLVFSGLQSSLEDVIGGSRATLRLAVCSSFGPGWLIPRLASFFAAHPQIDLQLRLYAQDPEQTDQVADAFVTALPVKPGFTAFHIVDEQLVPVRASGAPTNARQKRLPLITTDLEDGRLGEDWLAYCNLTGLKLSELQAGNFLQCTHYLLALEMARAGLGVALVPDFLAAREVEAGSVAYFDRTLMPSGRRYHLCFKNSRAQQDELRLLAQWMKSEKAKERAIRLVHSKNA